MKPQFDAGKPSGRSSMAEMEKMSNRAKPHSEKVVVQNRCFHEELRGVPMLSD
jgi:hypothetical protein